MKAQPALIRTIELKHRNGRGVGSKEVVTYQGLLSKAHEEGLRAVRTSLIQTPSEENGKVAIARAEVETERGLFQGYGDDLLSMRLPAGPHEVTGKAHTSTP